MKTITPLLLAFLMVAWPLGNNQACPSKTKPVKSKTLVPAKKQVQERLKGLPKLSFVLAQLQDYYAKTHGQNQ